MRRNRDLLGAALRYQLGDAASFAQPAGGLHLWLRLPEGRLDTGAAAMAGANGAIVIAGRHSFSVPVDMA